MIKRKIFLSKKKIALEETLQHVQGERERISHKYSLDRTCIICADEPINRL